MIYVKASRVLLMPRIATYSGFHIVLESTKSSFCFSYHITRSREHPFLGQNTWYDTTRGNIQMAAILSYLQYHHTS